MKIPVASGCLCRYVLTVFLYSLAFLVPIAPSDSLPPAEHKDFRDLFHTIEDIRQQAALKLDQAKRGEQGQYMTPAPTAELLASMFENLSGDVSLLDAGAGVGSLTAAFLQRVVQEGNVKKNYCNRLRNRQGSD